MSTKEELESAVKEILNQPWDQRESKSVPSTEQVALIANGAVNIEVTMLYADLADSTELAMNDRRMTAKIYKAFLLCASRLIKSSGGEIRSFDGDRVMGVFIGDYKNTSAAKCALQINYVFTKIIKPFFEEKYKALIGGDLKLAHCVGIDTGPVLVVKGGIRGDNDLLWVGQAPNVAAKLSGIRNDPYFTYITEAVYNKLNEEVKVYDGKQMWEKRVDSWKGVKGISTVYRSFWTWTP